MQANTYQPLTEEPKYAGFWIRFVASFIDGIVLFIPMMMIQTAASFLFGLNTESSGTNMLTSLSIVNVLNFAVGVAYFSVMESSSKQATLGKMAVGIQVVDEHGERLTFMRALGRYAGKILSGIILYIGYIMAGFTQKKQALHDKIAGTYVIYNR